MCGCPVAGNPVHLRDSTSDIIAPSHEFLRRPFSRVWSRSARLAGISARTGRRPGELRNGAPRAVSRGGEEHGADHDRRRARRGGLARRAGRRRLHAERAARRGAGVASRPRCACSTTTQALYSACSRTTASRARSSSTSCGRTSTPRNTDGFQIVIDTFHDERNGYQFAINPAGAKWDAQMVERGARNQRQLGRHLGRADAHRRERLVRGDRDSVPHAAIRGRRRCRPGASTSSGGSGAGNERQLLVAAAAHSTS